jgi:predicted nucleic acid-binding protein
VSLLVVDASVALKWVVAESGTDEANGLLSGRSSGELSLVAPAHLLGEVGNGLRKRVAQRLLSVADALLAMDAIAEIGLDLISDGERWRQTLRGAFSWEVTTYDAIYVLLAIDLGVDLVTADARLVEAARRHSLPVRSLFA